MNFTPFQRKVQQQTDISQSPLDPVPANLVSDTIRKKIAQRKVTILNPNQEEAYRLKASLLSTGHNRIETFFLPESFLDMVKQGHHPDVIFVHDFIAEEAGMTGVELARNLRLDQNYKGLIFSTSPDHRSLNGAILKLYGFSGHADDYLQST